MPRPPLRRRLAVAAEVLLIGVLGALIGLLLAGRQTTGVGPFEARMSIVPALRGGTDLSLPPLGELQLDSHWGLHLQVEVVRLREDEAREIVRDPDRLTGLGEEVRRDLTRGLLLLAAQSAAATVLGAAGLGLLVFRRNRRTVLAGATGLATLLSSAGVVYFSFDETSLAEPRYSGLLAVAPSAVGDVRDIVEDFGTYSRSLGKLVTNVTDLYAAASTLPVFEPQDEGIRLLHVSDLHLSPTGFEVLLSVAEQFQVDAIVDTGDITDFGSAAEARYVENVGRSPVPYVFIKGNHDSAATVEAVRAQGAVVLQPGRVQEVAGVRFLGAPDPRYTPDKTTRDDDAPDEVLLATGRRLLADVQSGADPDVVLVHDPKSAPPLRGAVPLVLAGHTHRRSASTEDGTLLLVQGSTGGAGLRGLEGEEPTPLELSVLYLSEDDQRLQAYDMVTLGGLGTSSARIERRVVRSEVRAAAEAAATASPTSPATSPTSPLTSSLTSPPASSPAPPAVPSR